MRGEFGSEATLRRMAINRGGHGRCLDAAPDSSAALEAAQRALVEAGWGVPGEPVVLVIGTPAGQSVANAVSLTRLARR